jgi:hypothetical protein
MSDNIEGGRAQLVAEMISLNGNENFSARWNEIIYPQTGVTWETWAIAQGTFFDSIFGNSPEIRTDLLAILPRPTTNIPGSFNIGVEGVMQHLQDAFDERLTQQQRQQAGQNFNRIITRIAELGIQNNPNIQPMYPVRWTAIPTRQIPVSEITMGINDRIDQLYLQLRQDNESTN